MDSVFDANFEIYDTLYQRRSNLVRRQDELNDKIAELTKQIDAMKGGVK